MQYKSDQVRTVSKVRFSWGIVWVMVALLMGATLVHPLSAQEAPPEISVTDINRTVELAWFQNMRNDRHPELSMILFDQPQIGYGPFNPAGAEASLDQIVADEVALQAALNFTFSEWMAIAEDDLVGFYGFQTGEFTGEYFGTPPTGTQFGGVMIGIDRFVDGRITESRPSWDQAGFMEWLGWSSVDYPDHENTPWGLTLGATSSTPADHHAILDALYTNYCVGCTPDFAPLYTEDVVVHDYMQTIEGLPTLSNQIGVLNQLADLQVDSKLAVCEGDLCISYATLSFTMADQPTLLVWASAHRFVDGKIAEEWWQYDNSVLWSATAWTE
jgi:predicted ester cyclase